MKKVCFYSAPMLLVIVLLISGVWFIRPVNAQNYSGYMWIDSGNPVNTFTFTNTSPEDLFIELEITGQPGPPIEVRVDGCFIGDIEGMQGELFRVSLWGAGRHCIELKKTGSGVVRLRYDIRGGYFSERPWPCEKLWPVKYEMLRASWYGPRMEPYRQYVRTWMKVCIENRGNEDVHNVKAIITGVPANVTVYEPIRLWDREVMIGDIPARSSTWSQETFVIEVNTAEPSDICEGITWRIEYEDRNYYYHVIENVPQFPPGESPYPECNMCGNG